MNKKIIFCIFTVVMIITAGCHIVSNDMAVYVSPCEHGSISVKQKGDDEYIISALPDEGYRLYQLFVTSEYGSDYMWSFCHKIDNNTYQLEGFIETKVLISALFTRVED